MHEYQTPLERVVPFVLSSALLLVVSNSDAQQVPAAARGFVEEMRIVSDERNPAMTLTMPNDLIVSEKGLLFTSHEDEGIVRVFDPNGKYLRSFGRKGQGPGEFSRAFNFHAAVGDTTIVYNFTPWSLVYFRDDGTYLRTVNIAPTGDPPKTLLAVSYLGANRIFAEVNYFSPRGSSNQTDSTVFWLSETSGRLIKRLGAAGPVASIAPAGSGWQVANPALDGEMRTKALYMVRTLYFADPFGRRGFIIHPPNAFGGTPDQFKVVTIGREGTESERILAIPARRLTARETDEFVDMLTNSIVESQNMPRPALLPGRSTVPRERPPATPRGEIAAQVRTQLSLLGTPPPVQGAIAGSDGSLWIRSMRNRLDWTVFTAAGAIAYNVHIPLNMRVTRVSLDRFWAITPDSDGLPIITRNRVAAAR